MWVSFDCMCEIWDGNHQCDKVTMNIDWPLTCRTKLYYVETLSSFKIFKFHKNILWYLILFLAFITRIIKSARYLKIWCPALGLTFINWGKYSFTSNFLYVISHKFMILSLGHERLVVLFTQGLHIQFTL